MGTTLCGILTTLVAMVAALVTFTVALISQVWTLIVQIYICTSPHIMAGFNWIAAKIAA